MQINITEEYDGITVKQYLYGVLRLSTRICKRLKYRSAGCGILQNGQPVTVRAVLHTGDTLTLATQDITSSGQITPHEMALPILYEDDDLIVVNKPPYMPTHPSPGHAEDTAANALAALFAARGTPFVFRCGSRLDRDTSGVLPVAKNQQAAHCFYDYHRKGQIQKTYYAMVRGIPSPPADTVTLPIGRAADSFIMRVCTEDGDACRTDYETERILTLPQSGSCALLRATPVTGRTHQLRVHFAALGCPILGDTLYGTAAPEIARQALHAARLVFPHPVTGELLDLQAPLPEDMQGLLQI